MGNTDKNKPQVMRVAVRGTVAQRKGYCLPGSGSKGLNNSKPV